MPNYDVLTWYLVIGISIAIAIPLIIYCLILIFQNPFRYPYFRHTFDVTSKRKVEIKDYIDNFLCDEDNWEAIQLHQQKIDQWKKETELRIQKHPMKKYRTKQYLAILDDERAYQFSMIRWQTRYRQRNYVKTSYKVPCIDSEWTTHWLCLCARRQKLAEIHFECTLKAYDSKEQRKLMTPALRQQIKIRDNFTCQRCGKYMPDEVGLHIDHIIPVVKGGKSVPSNLRVLCDKCNCNKGAKIEI